MADESPKPTPTLQIGSYRLVQQLGTGGMSSVFRAIHVESGHEVALKVLPRTLAKNPILLQRFLREAKSVEALDHPNIVAIYDRGVEEGRYYLVLEYVRGGDLHDRVREMGPLPVTEAIRIMRGVAEALRYAVGKGLIHRDLKPANILLKEDGSPKLADLGLALQIEDEDEQITRDGTTVGTVDYMSPEQARDSRATSLRSDIYSLGCTFYHILTGAAPFAGGLVPEKLRRHAFEPPPDVRKIRPDVPEALASLIRKMMAKKPDRRHGDYDELIQALDNISLGESGQGPFFALIDDEDAPLPVPADIAVPTGSTQTMMPAPEPLYALIDDEEDDNSLPPRKDSGPLSAAPVSVPNRPPRTVKPRSAPLSGAPVTASHPASRATAPSVDLSELAALDAPASRGGAASRPGPSRSPGQAVLPLATRAALPARRTADASLQDWIVRGLLAGIGIALVGIGFSYLSTLLSNSRSSEPSDLEREAQLIPGDTNSTPTPTPDSVRPRPTAASWTEPTDLLSRVSDPEPFFAGTLETVITPDWVKVEPAPTGPRVAVRRGSAVTAESAPDLVHALEGPAGFLDLDDTGPFRERGLKFGNRPRRIAAREGLRSIIVIKPTADADQPAALGPLEITDDLVLEGIDLVIPADSLPKSHKAVFVVRAGTLVLRDCTVTVAGTPDRPLSVVQLDELGDGRKPPRVRLERTIIRGSAVTAVRFGAGPGAAFLSRSLVLAGAAPAFQMPAARAEPSIPRTIGLLRCLIASQDTGFELTPGGRPPTVQIGAIGTTFLRIEGGTHAPALITGTTTVSDLKSLMDWSGDATVSSGWANWLSTGLDRTPVLAHLAAARAVWPTIGAHSRDRTTAGPAKLTEGWTNPDDLIAVVPEARAILQRVAQPSAFLNSKTVGAFDRLTLPPAPALAPMPDLTHSFEITNDAASADFGAFLAQLRPSPGVRRIRVQVTGQGTHPLNPITVPTGTVLEIQVAAPPVDTAPLEWAPAPGTDPSKPLLDARQADLVLKGVRLRKPADDSPRTLIRIEDGRLEMDACQIRAAGEPDAARPLILVRTTRTQPLPPSPGTPPTAPGHELPFARLTDTSLITTGDAITAELAHGVITLSNCAVAAGNTAFALAPQKVARIRFRADLWLDNCTIVTGATCAQLGSWPGLDSGPDRPWLVSSHNTAFLGLLPDSANSVLLRTDEWGLARGAWIWQSLGDGYELARYLTIAGGSSPNSVGEMDVERVWARFWGSSHVSRYLGPGQVLAGPKPILELDRLQPGDLFFQFRTGTSLGARPPAPKPPSTTSTRAATPPPPAPRTDSTKGSRVF